MNTSEATKPLTDIESIGYLLVPGTGEKKMKGTIRPISRQRKCPKCHQKFLHIPKLGYGCPKCHTVPNRFFIDLHIKGHGRISICSDKSGQTLDSYQRAFNLLGHIQYEIDNHTFDVSKYKKSELKEFYVANLLDKFLDFKIASIAPGYRTD